MARIRTIKPEFWTSEQVATCSPLARLLFIGLWSFCDDGGVHPASIKRLKMEVFPADAINDEAMQGLIGELISAQLVGEYEVDGTRYWYVTGWQRHQRIEHPTIRHPQPPDRPANSSNTRRTFDEHSSNTRRTFDEHSSNTRRILVERSPPEWNGRELEKNGTEGNGHSSLSPDGDCESGLSADSSKDDSEKTASQSTSLKFSDEDLKLAQEMFDGIKEIQPNARPPNLPRWANEFRLMREHDGQDRTPDNIRATLAWVRQDQFWKSNVLSPAKLREKWDQLQIKRKVQNESRPSSNKPDGLYRETTKPGGHSF
jgi:hypothetical protein